MKIRLAKLSDYEELMTLYDLFIKTDRYSKHTNDSFKNVLENSTSFIYVAEDKNKLVGLATFSIRSVVRFPQPIAQLDELFVLEQYRKHGIGKSFIDVLETKAKELNCCNIYIESRSDLKPAHQFYENLGYKKSGYYFKKVL